MLSTPGKTTQDTPFPALVADVAKHITALAAVLPLELSVASLASQPFAAYVQHLHPIKISIQNRRQLIEGQAPFQVSLYRRKEPVPETSEKL